MSIGKPTMNLKQGLNDPPSFPPPPPDIYPPFTGGPHPPDRPVWRPDPPKPVVDPNESYIEWRERMAEMFRRTL